MGGESLSAISSEAYFKGEGKGLDLSSHLLSLGMTLTKCFSSTIPPPGAEVEVGRTPR
jgi:hypothetical protein